MIDLTVLLALAFSLKLAIKMETINVTPFNPLMATAPQRSYSPQEESQFNDLISWISTWHDAPDSPLSSASTCHTDSEAIEEKPPVSRLACKDNVVLEIAEDKCCKAPHCSNVAQAQGFCKTHGGGSRCQFQGCAKSSQSRGLCRSHGGGKRCSEPGCTKGVQWANKCTKHGVNRHCLTPGCARADRGGGMCIVHRRAWTCTYEGCNRLSSSMGFCKPHARRLVKQRMA
ncbi:hypothetical protein LEN26_006978 [Aphanomyces euteiches]|nr:hypothetical protein LEN26_006978 [Aphanomyces euteiches]